MIMTTASRWRDLMETPPTKFKFIYDAESAPLHLKGSDLGTHRGTNSERASSQTSFMPYLCPVSASTLGNMKKDLSTFRTTQQADAYRSCSPSRRILPNK